MRRAPTRPVRDARRNGGFALILVLWTLALIAFITAHLVSTGRVEIRIAGNIAANAVAEAAVDGAVYQAVFNLMNPQAETRWALDGTAREFVIADCRVTVELHDETARINPNLAAPALLEALLRVTGSDAAGARRLAASIGEWVGAAATDAANDAIAAQYRAAGLDYAPPGEPLESLDEMRRILGITPEIFAAIRPHLSLFAPAEPTLADADPVVAAAMTEIGAVRPGTAPARSDVLTAHLAAVAQCPRKARAVRDVVVRIVPASQSYAVLAWRSDLG